METRSFTRRIVGAGIVPALLGFAVVGSAAAAGDQPSGGAPPPMAMMPMMSQMERMQQHMEAIEQSKDPAERRRLMDEHMGEVQGMMQMMHGMMASQGMMQGRGMGMGMGGPRGGGMAGAMPQDGGHVAPDLAARMEQIESRLDAMQLVLDQLVRSQRQMMRGQP